MHRIGALVKTAREAPVLIIYVNVLLILLGASPRDVVTEYWNINCNEVVATGELAIWIVCGWPDVAASV